MLHKVQQAALAFIIGYVLMGIVDDYKRAHPHDWYSGIRNPTTGVGCCGGNDCHPLMSDEMERLTEDADNYIIDGIWKFPKKGANGEQRFESGYSYCIWGGKPRCFFFPTSA
jgi:hypothetical protein